MCIVPFGTIYMLFNIDMGNRPRAQHFHTLDVYKRQELLNSLRLMFSRLASHRCPNGHTVAPTLAVAAGQKLTCPECGANFYAPSAEELAFNSQGACRTCDGTGVVRTVDRASLVPDESLTIEMCIRDRRYPDPSADADCREHR